MCRQLSAACWSTHVQATECCMGIVALLQLVEQGAACDVGLLMCRQLSAACAGIITLTNTF
ncbi:hypothetical protein I3760_13G120300 [Carya illinoinensis]|nr:hypothetical protein I3760_13G120300 [Carya illinoinensis]